MRPTLGTFVEIYAKSEQSNLEDVIDGAYNEVIKINNLLSFHDVNSDLNKLNLAKGQQVTLDPISIKVLKMAKSIMLASNGYFNCTVGGALVKKGALPSHDNQKYLTHGTASDIEILDRKVRLKRNVLITLDGIAKGYAVDCAVNYLKSKGISAGWVNAGGDIRVFGDLIMPIHRRELDGTYTTLGGLKETAMATSAVREQFDASFPALIVGGKQTPEVGTWTVLAKEAWLADALTKVACIACADDRKQIIEELGGVLV